MQKDYARLNTKIYNVPLARRFKSKLAREGITYRAWLAETMKSYVGVKATPKKAAPATKRSNTKKMVGAA